VSGAAEAYADDDLVLREITETPARAGLNINWIVAPSPRKRRAFALRLAAEVEALSEGWGPRGPERQRGPWGPERKAAMAYATRHPQHDSPADVEAGDREAFVVLLHLTARELEALRDALDASGDASATLAGITRALDELEADAEDTRDCLSDEQDVDTESRS